MTPKDAAREVLDLAVYCGWSRDSIEFETALFDAFERYDIERDNSRIEDLEYTIAELREALGEAENDLAFFQDMR